MTKKHSLDSFTVKFYPNEQRSKDNNFKIYARVTVNRRKCEFYTNISIPQHRWDLESNSPKDIAIDDDLYEIQTELRRIRRRFIDKSMNPTAKDIVNAFRGDEDKLSGIQFLHFYNEVIAGMIRLDELSKSTIKHYRGTYKILEEYLRLAKKQSILTEEIDLRLLRSFNEYLVVDYRTNKGESITKNTAGKHHSRLKAILNRAIEDGLIERSPYDKFKIRFEKTERDRLTSDELKLFEELDVKTDMRNQEVLDVFLFTCYTGVRFEDGQALTSKNIIKEGDELAIRFRMTKTNEPITVPLIQKAIVILDRYKRVLANDRLLPNYSNQKFNLYFKEIVRMTNLGRDITHHIGRHTFATTALNNGIPLEVVQKVLGHNSIRTTQIYAKMLPKTIREQMKKME